MSTLFSDRKAILDENLGSGIPQNDIQLLIKLLEKLTKYLKHRNISLHAALSRIEDLKQQPALQKKIENS